MTTIYSVYDQIADLLAKLDPNRITALKASEEVQKRFDFLTAMAKEQELDKKQKDELDHFIVLERLMRIAKIRAENTIKA